MRCNRWKVLLLLIAMLVSSMKVFALSADSAILIDAASGKVLKEVNAYQKRGMASTTKIMTALVALENSNPDDVVTVSATASGVEGSSLYLVVGEKLTMEQLLYGLMLHSGNDAATAIAEHVAGSVDDFAVLMNKKAVELGLKNTHFTNPHGLDNEQHYTTAYDLAMLTKHALQNETFAKIVATKQTKIGENEQTRYLTNHNKLLRMYEGANGVKTGFTKKDGRCLVSSATRDGITLIAVTLAACDDWNDHMEMFNYGFGNFKGHQCIRKGEQLYTVETRGCDQNLLAVTCDKDVFVTVKSDDITAIRVEHDLPQYVDKPIAQNEKVGTATIYIGSDIAATADLIAQNEITLMKPSQTFEAKEEGIIETIVEFIDNLF